MIWLPITGFADRVATSSCIRAFAHSPGSPLACFFDGAPCDASGRRADRRRGRVVADGVVANRSEAVRLGLESLIEQHRRRKVGPAIVDAYCRLPQTRDELAGLDEATRDLVYEEPC